MNLTFSHKRLGKTNTLCRATLVRCHTFLFEIFRFKSKLPTQPAIYQDKDRRRDNKTGCKAKEYLRAAAKKRNKPKSAAERHTLW
jgi:hypothetical protein